MKYQLLLLTLFLSAPRAQGFDEKGNFVIPKIEQWNLESMIVKNGVLFSPVSKDAFSGLVFEMDGYGNVISERYYKDGVFNGYENRIEYFDKGSWSKRKKEIFYFNGKKHGLFLEWDIYGDKVVEGYYKMERKDGIWTSWLDGIKVEQKTFVKDKKEGSLIRWYENGRVKYKVTYKSNRNIGVECWDLSGFECTCFTYPDEISCL